MRALFRIILVSILASCATAAAWAEVPEPCLQDTVRNHCLTSCAVACKDATFLAIYASYCLDNNLLDSNAELLEDPPSCKESFGDSAAGGDVDCSTLTVLSERLLCEQRAEELLPRCAPSVADLAERAGVLITEIQSRLADYGDLLVRDFKDVRNHDALCAYSRADLDESYQIATSNPEVLATLQTNATDIQDCRAEWETFVRSTAGTSAPDSLVDRVARESQDRLGPLQDQLQHLSQSIEKLRNAAAEIEEIAKIHLVFCDPNGTPTQQ